MPNALTFAPVYDYGIKDPNFVLGPKIPKANEYHSIIASTTQRMVAGELSPAETGAELTAAAEGRNWEHSRIWACIPDTPRLLPRGLTFAVSGDQRRESAEQSHKCGCRWASA